LGRFDGRAFARFTRQDGLAGHRITALHTDARGVLWVGSYGDGVAGYNEFGRIGGGVATNGAGRFFVAGGVPEFGDGGVSSIRAAPDGALWFGNRVGFSKFDGQLFRIWARRASV
jgi:ligand-binding sensor domain-containing protein